MNDDQIYEKLSGIFYDIFDEKDIVLTSNTTAADIETWDSFNHVNLIVAIESSFDVKFSTQEIEAMEDVGDIVLRLKTKLGATT
jgi:acyl carrier protein